MKLLRVKANNFKNCVDGYCLDFVSKSKRTKEDKEYELLEVAPGLYAFATLAIVGKNASGKTSVLELLDACYSLLGEYRLEGKPYSYEDVELEMTFYHEGYLYLYSALLGDSPSFGHKAVFKSETLKRKKYFKNGLSSLYDLSAYKDFMDFGSLPEDTSKLFFVLGKKATRGVYFDSYGKGAETYALAFKAMEEYGLSEGILLSVLSLFDPNVKGLKRLDDSTFRLQLEKESLVLSPSELLNRLSSGTTKGLLLYLLAVSSLQNGFDLIVDEIENHFHKTLVENLISLYRDKSVNRLNATLIFSTHYSELLDLMGRQDNVYICHDGKKITISNMYEDYSIRPELLKSKQYYGNAFGNAVDYEALMDLKRKLKP